MSDLILTLVITEPFVQPNGGTLTRMLTLDEHGCEVGWYGLDTAGYGYGPTAEHPERAFLGWPEGIDQPLSFYNNVDEGWAVPSFDAGVMAAAYETAERIDVGWDFTTECAGPDGNEDDLPEDEDEDDLLAHEAAHEAGSATLLHRDDCADCNEAEHEAARPSARSTDLPAPSSASVELQYLADRFVAYRVVVLVTDALGYTEERHVWTGSERFEGERAAEIARKALGAVRGLTVTVR